MPRSCRRSSPAVGDVLVHPAADRAAPARPGPRSSRRAPMRGPEAVALAVAAGQRVGEDVERQPARLVRRHGRGISGRSTSTTAEYRAQRGRSGLEAQDPLPLGGRRRSPPGPRASTDRLRHELLLGVGVHQDVEGERCARRHHLVAQRAADGNLHRRRNVDTGGPRTAIPGLRLPGVVDPARQVGLCVEFTRWIMSWRRLRAG
jgi:hypothetical protein